MNNDRARPKIAYAAELLHDAAGAVEAAARQLAAAGKLADDLDRWDPMRMGEIVPMSEATTRHFIGLSDQLIDLTQKVREYESRLRYVERQQN